MNTIDKDIMENSFQFTKEQKGLFKELTEANDLSGKHQKLIEEYIKANALPCYNFAIIEGEKRTALDSSMGGIPYCPIGEELPVYTKKMVSELIKDDWYGWIKNQTGKEIPLLIQINFEGIDLPGYPNKGIFQIFGGYSKDDYDGCLPSHFIARYYENVSNNYRKDILPAYNDAVRDPSKSGFCGGGSYKIKLEKSWSIHSLLYCEEYDGEFEKQNPKEAVILEKLRELETEIYGEEEMVVTGEVLEGLFPHERSRLGGHGGPTPQGTWLSPKESLLFLACDLLCWGDCGAIVFFYEDITKLKKDQWLEARGDMS